MHPVPASDKVELTARLHRCRVAADGGTGDGAMGTHRTLC